MDDKSVKWVAVAYDGCDKVGSVLLEGDENDVYVRAKKWGHDVYNTDDVSVHQIN